MLGLTGSSYAAFAVVWGLLCLLSGALVTDTMLRDARPGTTSDRDQGAEAAADPDRRFRG